MRLLVACSRCKRQYDATGQPVGSRFHCQCGEEIETRPPQGHDASVVRCASCGAPREEQATACRFCTADFTIHETDLHTVCPICLARISDRARYCHHCGTSLTAESLAGDRTEHTCPACQNGQRLTSRQFGKEHVSVLECTRCAGMWVGIETLHVLVDHAARNPGPVPEKGAWEPERQRGYRPCAICGQLMSRRNFAGKSGVIVDLCGTHGIWFDAHELSRLLSWIRGGGLDAARAELTRLKKLPASRASARQIASSDVPKLTSESAGFALTEMLFGLFEIMGNFDP